MAANAFDALMAEVNREISQANMAASQANAAAAQAGEAASAMEQQTQQAETAAQQAQTAAQQALSAADAWNAMTVAATTGAPGSEASVTMTQEAGRKKLSFVIPRGAAGAQGAKGEPGRSGVSFTISGSALYITTN